MAPVRPAIRGLQWRVQCLHQPEGDKQSDIKDNDTAFPSDLVWYLFNENDDATGWANLESRAVQMLTNCDSLSTASRGLIIVDGDCKPGGSVGSVAAPVVLIVRNGDLMVNGSATLYGLVFAYSSTPATATTDISLKGGLSSMGQWSPTTNWARPPTEPSMPSTTRRC